MIGIRELQQHASKLVREVQTGKADYRITVQGRDTGVALTPAPTTPGKPVASADPDHGGTWDSHVSPEAKQRLLDFIEKGREDMGYIGE